MVFSAKRKNEKNILQTTVLEGEEDEGERVPTSYVYINQARKSHYSATFFSSQFENPLDELIVKSTLKLKKQLKI